MIPSEQIVTFSGSISIEGTNRFNMRLTVREVFLKVDFFQLCELYQRLNVSDKALHHRYKNIANEGMFKL